MLLPLYFFISISFRSSFTSFNYSQTIIMIDSYQNKKGSLKNNDLLSYFLFTTLLYKSKKLKKISIKTLTFT